MFQKKEFIYSESLGPCQVEDIVKLAAQKNVEPVPYYVLRSVTEKKKISYIPVEHHRSLLRPLISAAEARERLTKKVEEKEEKKPQESNITPDTEEIDRRLLEEARFVLSREKE